MPSEPSEQLAQGGPGRAGRQRRDVEVPGGRGRAQPADQLVEAPVARRGLAGRPRGRAAADRHVLEALREVPERQPARAEQALELGAAQRPRRPARGRETRVDVLDGVQAREVERHDGRRSRRARASTPPTTLVPPPKGTTATPGARAGLEHGAHLPVVGGQHDGVGRPVRLARAEADEVGVALAGGVEHARARGRSRTPSVAHRRRAARGARRRPAPTPAGARPRARRAALGVAERAAEPLGAARRGACGGSASCPARPRPSPQPHQRIGSAATGAVHLLEPVQRLVERSAGSRGAPMKPPSARRRPRRRWRSLDADAAPPRPRADGAPSSRPTAGCARTACPRPPAPSAGPRAARGARATRKSARTARPSVGAQHLGEAARRRRPRRARPRPPAREVVRVADGAPRPRRAGRRACGCGGPSARRRAQSPS